MKPALSCNNCRARKKKCDRGFPICSYCLQTSHRCIYRKAQIVVPSSSTSLSPRSASHFNRQDGWLTSARYLDLARFNGGPHISQQDIVAMYPEMLEIIKDIPGVQRLTELYLECVDPWMSLIPLKDIMRMMENPLGLPGDQTLLIASIKLVMTPLTEDDPVTKDYLTLKMVFVRLEAAGTVTLQITQARFLLLLYEFGHGLCQAAYISLGAGMRYLSMAKAETESENGNGNDVPELAQGWLIDEQYRRLWWMGFIFDRVLNLGLIEPPSLVLDSAKTRILPSDEISWRQEGSADTTDLTLASPPIANMGHFRLLVLASNLVGIALEHAKDLRTQSETLPGRTEQIYRTLCSFLKVLEIEGLSLVSIGVSRSIICSAMYALYPLDVAGEGDSASAMTEDSPLSIFSFMFLDRARQYASGMLPTNKEAAPFLLHWGYNAYLFYYRKFHIHHKDEDRVAINDLARGLHDLNRRWKIASVYLNMLGSVQVVDKNAASIQEL